MICLHFRSPSSKPADVAVFFLYGNPSKNIPEIPSKFLTPEIRSYLKSGDCRREEENLSLFPTPMNPRNRRYLFAGLGNRETFQPAILRKTAARVIRYAAEQKWKIIRIPLLWTDILSSFSPEIIFRSLIEGLYLGAYRYDRYKKNALTIPEIYLETDQSFKHFPELLKNTEALMRGVFFSRDLSNTPASDCTPLQFAREVQQMARQEKIGYRLFRSADLKRLKMNGILSVSRGSVQEPVMVELTYRHRRAKNKKPIVLIGKGVTFDSGGLHLKPGNFMDQMKMDMSGGAAVAGIFQAVARMELPVHIIGLIPLAENMPGGNAFKPGDIIRLHNGITVEITHTDAEGRLLLADALLYAQKFNPMLMIDIATLTGACAVALGPYAAGLMGNSEEWKIKLLEASQATDERLWELPLWPELDKTLKSQLADMKNSGSRYGGALFAGAFLRSFTAGKPWIHLDIAGTAYGEEDSSLWNKNEATGFGVRLLTFFLHHHIAQ